MNFGSPLTVSGISISSGFTVYPNPASGQITICAAAPLKMCCVRDVTGKTIACSYAWLGSLTEMKMELPVAAGLYTVEITFGDGSVQSQPVIVAEY